ncbi:hypothetical protein NUKP67_44480 [Klebsiella variicola]|nr:hypothetical protein NUKP67_44480 [Klebsiella variicola]
MLDIQLKRIRPMSVLEALLRESDTKEPGVVGVRLSLSGILVNIGGVAGQASGTGVKTCSFGPFCPNFLILTWLRLK